MGTLVHAILLCIALGSVVTLNRAAATGPKPAFDWTQFLKGVKRAADTDAAVPDTEEVDIDYQDSQFQIKPMVSNPMSPFLSMKPFLPMKPTFMPPLVDPQYFIDKKTALLNSLFSSTGPIGGKAMGAPPFGGAAMAPNYFAGKKTAFLSTLFNQLATPPPSADTNVNATKPADENVLQRRLIAPWLTTPPPVFDPKIMADKKTAFLDKLFSSFDTTTTGDDTLDTATVKPTIVPADFWMPFPAKPKTAVKPAVKPTIVPPDFWLPFPAASVPLKPIAPVVDPSIFIDKKTKFIDELMKSLSAPPTPVTAPPSTDIITSSDEEVSQFLDRLVEALLTPAIIDLKRSVMDVARSARSATPTTETPDIPLSAKDKVMNTIIGELSGIKNNMVDTVTQMLKEQKEVAIVAPVPGAKLGKKVAPFGAAFGGAWGPMAKVKPTPDPTIAFQQKIDVLNQVFDMLTNLQKDVVAAVNEVGSSPANTTTTPVKKATNMTILDLLRNKLMEMDDGKASETKASKYNVRGVNELQEPEDTTSKVRSIKMAVHQGYQSFPPGTTEMLQAGGGSSPQGQEGGGITLQKPNTNPYDAWESRRHHHHNK